MARHLQHKTAGLSTVNFHRQELDQGFSNRSILRQLKVVDAIIRAKEELRDASLPQDRGPYADGTGRALKRFVDRHFRKARGARMTGDRIMEHMRDGTIFSINDRLAIPNRLPVAGEILSQTDDRVVRDEEGKPTFAFIDMLELMAVSTAVLRQRGFAESYPTFIATDQGGGKVNLEAAITLFDTSVQDSPEFLLLHFSDSMPEPDNLILVGDNAMMGALNALLALGRANRFIDSFSSTMAYGGRYPRGMVDAELRYIAEALADCHIAWPDCFYIPEVLAKLETGLRTELILKNVHHPTTFSEEISSMARGFLIRFMEMAESGSLGFKSS